MGHFNNKEATIDYLQRRDLRVKNYNKNNQHIFKLSDKSPENSENRSSLIEKLTRGSTSGPNDQMFRATNGWVISKEYRKKQE